MSVRVSVIIRTFNRAAYLDAAIQSVLTQTCPAFELLVVDDGSTDETARVLARYENRLTHVALAHTGNPTAVLNAGIRAARGNCIALLDDDDLWLPDKLERQVRKLFRDPRFGFAYGNVQLLFADGTLSAPALRPAQLLSGSILRMVIQAINVHPSTLLVRREWLDRIGLLDDKHAVAETFFLTLRLARVTQAACVPEPVALIRQHTAQTSTERGAANYYAAIEALEMLLQDRELEQGARGDARHTLAQFHTHLGKSFIEQGRMAKARAHVRAALVYDPLYRPAWRWLARAYVMHTRRR
jgi:glycosyltransferase involved in cell wall biosynthesis